MLIIMTHLECSVKIIHQLTHQSMGYAPGGLGGGLGRSQLALGGRQFASQSNTHTYRPLSFNLNMLLCTL